jgi:hypothetical protein
MSYELFQQGSSINLLDMAPIFKGVTLIVQMGKQSQLPKKEFEKLRDAYRKCDLQHAVEEPFWREIKRYYGRAQNLYGATTNWLGDQ